MSDLKLSYNPDNGLVFKRRYTTEGKHPYEAVVWGRRDVKVTSASGKVIFAQNNVEFPDNWSQNAVQIVTSKYFHGQQNTPQRETSLRQLIDRVALTIGKWGKDGGYFASHENAEIFIQELIAILLNQYASFNSPVWFNAGTVPKPQLAACFINSIEDTMDSILDLAKTEGLIFKYGSGSGVNLSKLRAKGEPLSTGGSSSGPISFMRGYDAFAGSIKSGGKTRRAAKMVIMDIWHPDVVDFINSKAEEEKKAWALIDAGYDASFTGEAYNSVFFQNANHSVRVSDEFMQKVLNNEKWNLTTVTAGKTVATFRARDLLNKISEATHLCGDPGLQYSSIINKWHTCKVSGPINASNPCSEFIFLDDSACNLASINLLKYRIADGSFDIDGFIHTVNILITAQEIIVGKASYPTLKIEENSHLYRPLGLGFTNLGALLLSLGLPYDSDAGRNVSAAISSLMTGQAYLQSARIAANIGPFEKYEENKKPMLDIIQMHLNAAKSLKHNGVDSKLYEVATSIWDETLKLGREYGYRNAQSSVIAPTGCLTGNTLVPTDNGLLRLGTIGNPMGDKWQDISFNVQTDEGPKQASKFFINGVELTRKIKTSAGYEIQGTYSHRIKIVNPETKKWQWKRLSDIKMGDIVPIAFGQNMGSPRPVILPPLGDLHWNVNYYTIVPREVSNNLAELVGYYMGDGSLHARGLRFCVPNDDLDVIDRLSYLVKDLFNLSIKQSQKEGYIEVSVNSVPITIWWDVCGFSKIKPNKEFSGKGYQPHIPNAILETNDTEIYGAFLRGLFEADGTVTSYVPAWSSASAEFAKEVRTLLLILGIPTSTKVDAPYESHLGKNDVTILRLRNKSYNLRFMGKIGFISSRKEALVDLSISERSQRYDHVYLSSETIEQIVPLGHDAPRNVQSALRQHNSVPRDQLERLNDETNNIELEKVLNYFFDKVKENNDGGEQYTYDLSVPENVTYVANGFISHNTISFKMDADTTGIEPDMALIKYKKLVGGGYMKIVNSTIPLALKQLGYSADEIDRIVNYIDQNGTIEGCSDLDNKHLNIFDCSFKSLKGSRVIHYMAHVKMMAVVQPFISGAISKTVNIPEDATVDEISEVYIKAWQMGVKAIAIYRNNSKRLQPMSTKDESTTEKDVEKIQKYVTRTGPIRRRLPETRDSRIHKFEVSGHEGYIIAGLYDDGTPGEVFIKMSKQGSTLGGVMDTVAVLTSMSLQYGVPLSALVRKFIHSKFEPSGMTNNPKIPIASSIIDYIFRWLALEFLPEDERPEVLDYTDLSSEESFEPVVSNGITKQPNNAVIDDNQICQRCGAIAVRSGSCYACPECGTTSGCS